MKSSDKFLIAIVAGAILLVVVTLVLALLQPKPTYRAEDTPEGVAHNYLLAIQQGDSARAYGYLSPTLKGYPASADAFGDQVRNYSFNFRLNENSAFAIQPAQINGDRADVPVQERRFNRGGWFTSSSNTSTFQVRLARDKELGAWKIIKSDAYWVYCWDAGGCR